MWIDPHVHLRGGEEEKHKETLVHGFSTAWRNGLSGLFEMPNTRPALTGRQAVIRRIKEADAALRSLNIPLFHGVLAGITPDDEQIREVISLWKEFFPRVCGLKMFAGHSTGNMGITETSMQKRVYEELAAENYTGVLMLHCEKESLMKPEVFNPLKPETHLQARPPEAEVESVKDQLEMAGEAGFEGTLHICHISVPESLNFIEEKRKQLPFNVTCGITPHHALLSVSRMEQEGGILLKVNPPLRTEEMQSQMLQALLDERIDWIETDHAPHALDEKVTKHYSGIPGLQYYPVFINKLRTLGMTDEAITRLTFTNIVETFNLPEELFTENPNIPDVSLTEYGFDPYSLL